MMIRIRLSTLLGEKRWEQAELARKTGIRQGTINDMYNELSDRVSLRHLEAICEVLDCKLSDILVEDPSRNRPPKRQPPSRKTEQQ